MLNKDKDYHSYSSILNFIEDGPKSLITEKKKSTKGLSIGKALDVYMFDDFDKKYYISDLDIKLTSMETTFLDIVEKQTSGELNDEIIESDEFRDLCNEIAVENDLFKSDRKGKDGNIKERIDNISIVLKDRLKAGSKTVIDPLFYIKIVDMAEKLKNNQYVKDFFNNKNISKYQNLNQITRIFEYEGIKFKVILDILHINHENKTIQEVDLKYTSMKGSDFLKSFFKYRYDIQSTLYTLALKDYRDEYIELKEYSILEPSIVCVNDTEEPMLYKVTSSDLYDTFYGYEDRHGRYHNGILNIVSDIEFHIKNESFEYPREYYEQKVITIQTNRANNYGNSLPFVRPLNRRFKNKITNERNQYLGKKEKDASKLLSDALNKIKNQSFQEYKSVKKFKYKNSMPSHNPVTSENIENVYFSTKKADFNEIK